eukprot:5186638-Pleurochrysis_carterae.AAC.1
MAVVVPETSQSQSGTPIPEETVEGLETVGPYQASTQRARPPVAAWGGSRSTDPLFAMNF